MRRKPERKGEAVPPVNLLKLMEAVGPSRASRELGVSTTTLHKAKKYGLVSKSIEVAARAVLLDFAGETAALVADVAPAPATRPTRLERRAATFMLEVDPDKAELVEKFADMVQAKLLRA